MADPDFIGRLRAINGNLEHARRFTLHPNDWRSAVTQAEGDIEELLIDYGFQPSTERDPDRRAQTSVVVEGDLRTTTITEALS